MFHTFAMTNNAGSNDSARGSALNELDEEMKRLSMSDHTVDISTLVYVWGYPLINRMRDLHYFTQLWNKFSSKTELPEVDQNWITPLPLDSLTGD